MLQDKISLIGKDALFYTTDIYKLIDRCETINSALIKIEEEANTERIEYSIKPAIFVKINEIFITFENNTQQSNNSFRKMKTDQTIFTRTMGAKTELLAQTEGYLVADNGIFSIFDPYRLSKNKVHLYFIFIPIDHGEKSLSEYFFQKASLPSRESLTKNFSEDVINRIINSGSGEKITLSMGVPPDYGYPGTLLIKKQVNSEPGVREDGSIDYHSFSAFLEVEKGTVLVEKTESKQEHPGIDAFGEEISVPAVRKLEFVAGKNVVEVQSNDGTILYKAEVTGILELADKSVSVAEELHIKGNVCAETGNISYSKSIIVDGNIEYMFKVECGATLTIKGSVENGSLIQCEGDIFIEKGIIGEKTNFLVKGNVETGFIQEAKIRVLGNLKVNSYIYNSNVFCGGELQVLEGKTKNQDRGVILGSIVSSMKQMSIHSAGSGFSKTTLSCGIDLELKEQLDEMEKAIPLLNKKIIGLQNRTGIDLSQKGIETILKALPKSRKDKIKIILTDIKNTNLQKKTIEKKVETFKGKAVNCNTEELTIQVSSHIVPELQINIGELKRNLEAAEKSIRISIENNTIVFNPLGK